LSQAATDIAVDIKNVTKRYGATVALANLTLQIRDNEFFTLLGPSGCGKTTLLRSIAGFEAISDGDIHLFGESLAGLPPNKRPINTVFQHYALFPHMSVTDNVLFGLRRQRVPDAEARQRAADVLELVQLSALAERMPSQLSGGQQQRVALARALAPRPRVLLLDEPLSALDLKLRQEVRIELQQIQDNTGITFIFVTHDQEEAITMSDRIAVISEGELQQVGAPRDIYESPSNRFVADFIGETNLIGVNVQSIDGDSAHCALPDGTVLTCRSAADATTGASHLSIRPERLSLANADDAQISGTVVRHTYLGTDMRIAVELGDGTTLTARLQNTDASTLPANGDRVGLAIAPGAARLLTD
jgi:spermidine/putrescine transport system ATP-binding protein